MSANIVRFSGDYKIQAGFGTNQQANIYLGTKNNGTVYVDGNLLVSGTTTAITTQNTTIKDNIITLNAGESGSAVSLTLAGIEIDRGTNSNGKAQFLFDESIQWAHPNGTTRYGIFKFETATGGINGIRTNSIDTNGGNLNLINYSTGVIKVTGTNNYEEQVVEYDNNHDIVMPINPIDDDIIPNIKTVIDYVSNISNVGNVGITQNGGTLNIGLNKTVTISNTLTFDGTDDSTVHFGAGGNVTYRSNKLNIFSATSSSELAGVISDETGSGLLVFNNSPTLITPTLGAALATSINGLTISSSTGTITIANGKTLTASNTLTFTGTNGSTVDFTTGGIVGYTGSTGDNLSSFASTTSAELAGVISDETGTGSLVFANTPTLVTPVLGAATATTINKVTISSVATGSTLTIADNKIFTVNNTLTFNGTDASSVEFGIGGTVTYTRNKLSVFSATTSSELAGVISDETGTGALVFGTSPTLVTPVLGVATATTINGLTISTSTGTITIANGKTLTASNTLTFTGNDTSSIEFGSGGTVAYTSSKLNAFSSTTSAELAGVISDETGSGSLVFGTSPTISGHPTIEGVTSTGSTGTGKFVFDGSPTLVTPTLGVATATTVNKVTLTTPATGSTLTIADGRTLTASNTLTFTGTDTSSVEFGIGGTVTYTRNKLSVFSATTSAELAGVISDETGTGALVFGTSPTISGHPTIEGVTSTGATGTGLLVFNNSPTIAGHPTVEGVTSTGATGTGKFVFDGSPTLVTPTIGVATATSINGLTISSSTGTLTIANSKTLTASNTLTFTGTDTSSVEFGIGGTVTYTRNKLSVFSATTSSELAGVISDETGTGLLVFGTSPTLSTSILTDSTTFGLVDSTATTVNFAGAATTITIGATTGTLNLRNAIITAANATTFNMNGTNPSIVTSNTGTANVFNTNALTGNLFGAATTIGIGASTGIITVGNPTLTGTNLDTFNMNGANPSIVTSSTGTASIFNTNATTGNLFGAATTIAIGASTGTLTIGNATITGTNVTSFNMNGASPSITTTSTGTASVFNTNALTGNLFGAATTIAIGASTGTITLGNQTLTGTNLSTFNMNGTTPINIATSRTSSTANIFDSNVLTGNLFGAATTIAIGASSGTITIKNTTITGTNATAFNMNGASPSIVTSSTGTASVFNTNALTGNLFGAATTIAIGASTGTLTIGNATITGSNATAFNMNGTNPSIVTSDTGTSSVFNTNALTGNLFGAATSVTIGSTTGTLNLRNATITAANATTFNMNGTNPSIVTSNTGTANVFNTNALTGNLFGDATAITIGAINSTITLRNQTLTGSYLSTFNMNGTSPLTIATSTASSTANVFNTNVITGNLFGGATTIGIGASTGTLTIGNPTVVGTQITQNLYNTTATTMNFAGAATTTNISDSGNINLGSSTSATTTVKVGGAISGNILKIASTTIGTITVSSDVTTGTINLFTNITTGTINVGSANNGIVDVAFTTESTSTTTGAVVVAGGVGIEKNLYVGESTTMMFQTTDPVADAGGVTVYTKNSDLNNTGIYYVNSNVSGELVSKKKALAYSIVFG